MERDDLCSSSSLSTWSYDVADRPWRLEIEEIPSLSFWREEKREVADSIPALWLKDPSKLQDFCSLTKCFNIKEIKSATRNFDRTNIIGMGGFSTVYRGELPDGIMIAVKRFRFKQMQVDEQFMNELGISCVLQHPNIVKLLGYCRVKEQHLYPGKKYKELMLIYEHDATNSLEKIIVSDTLDKTHSALSWGTRQNICLGIARALAYLHGSGWKIVHRLLSRRSVLVDKDNNVKICGFGGAIALSTSASVEDYLVANRGYMDPNYNPRGAETSKVDIYCFGIIMLEIISGHICTSFTPEKDFCIIHKARSLQYDENLLELVDSHLGSNYPKEEALSWIRLALLCCNISPTLRPTMFQVLNFLEGRNPFSLTPSMNLSLTNSDISHDELQNKELENITINHDNRPTDEVPVEKAINPSAMSSELDSLFLTMDKIQLPSKIKDVEEEKILLSCTEDQSDIFKELKALISLVDYKEALRSDVESRIIYYCQVLRSTSVPKSQLMLLDQIMDFLGLNSELSNNMTMETKESLYIENYDSLELKVEEKKCRAKQMKDQAATLHSSLALIEEDRGRIMKQMTMLQEELDSLDQRQISDIEKLAEIKSTMVSSVDEVTQLAPWLKTESSKRLLAGERLRHAKESLSKGQAKWKCIQDGFL